MSAESVNSSQKPEVKIGSPAYDAYTDLSLESINRFKLLSRLLSSSTENATAMSEFGKANHRCEYLLARFKALESGKHYNLPAYVPPQPGSRVSYTRRGRLFEILIL
jgi:hypothetical protein